MSMSLNGLQPSYSLASTYEDFKAFLLNYGVVTAIIGVTIGIMARGAISSLVTDVFLPSFHFLFFRHVPILQQMFSSFTKYNFPQFLKELFVFTFATLLTYSLIDNIVRRNILNIPGPIYVTQRPLPTSVKPITSTTTAKPTSTTLKPISTTSTTPAPIIGYTLQNPDTVRSVDGSLLPLSKWNDFTYIFTLTLIAPFPPVNPTYGAAYNLFQKAAEAIPLTTSGPTDYTGQQRAPLVSLYISAEGKQFIRIRMASTADRGGALPDVPIPYNLELKTPYMFKINFSLSKQKIFVYLNGALLNPDGLTTPPTVLPQNQTYPLVFSNTVSVLSLSNFTYYNGIV